MNSLPVSAKEDLTQKLQALTERIQRLRKTVTTRARLREKIATGERKRTLRSVGFKAWKAEIIGKGHRPEARITGAWITSPQHHEKILTQNPNTVKKEAAKIFEGITKKTAPTPDFITKRCTKTWQKMSKTYRAIMKLQHTRPDVSQHFANLMDEPTEAEIESAIDRQKSSKAAGPSQTSPEMWKAMTGPVKDLYHSLVRSVFATRKFPREALKQIITPISKTEDSVYTIDTSEKPPLRPISLCELCSKHVEAILAARLTAALTKAGIINPLQYGFQEGVSTAEPAMLTNLILEDAKKHKRRLLGCLNDNSAAYDRVPFWALMLALEQIGVPQAYIELIQHMLENSTAKVLTGHGYTEEFAVQNGLGQGRLLAPLHWILYLNPLLNHLEEHDPAPYRLTDAITGLPSKRIEIPFVAFADDTTFFSETMAGLKWKVSTASAYFNYTGGKYNGQKTKFFSLNENQNITEEQEADDSSPPQLTQWDYSPDGKLIKTTEPLTRISTDDTVRLLGYSFTPKCNWAANAARIESKVKETVDYVAAHKISAAEARIFIGTVVKGIIEYDAQVSYIDDKEMKRLDTYIRHNLLSKYKGLKSVNGAEQGFHPSNAHKESLF